METTVWRDVWEYLYEEEHDVWVRDFLLATCEGDALDTASALSHAFGTGNFKLVGISRYIELPR